MWNQAGQTGKYLKTTDVLLEKTFRLWTEGKDALQSRISIYEKIRDIPYAVLPELVDAERYIDILTLGKGSCTPKHFLLCNLFQRLGLLVLFAVYPFRWIDNAEVVDDYPQPLKKLTEGLPMSHHLACRVEIGSRLVLVDATLDSPLERAGLPVNHQWNGFSDTLLPMMPCGEEQLYHPSEAHLMEPRSGQPWREFYAGLNAFLEEVRRH